MVHKKISNLYVVSNAVCNEGGSWNNTLNGGTFDALEMAVTDPEDGNLYAFDLQGNLFLFNGEWVVIAESVYALAVWKNRKIEQLPKLTSESQIFPIS